MRKNFLLDTVIVVTILIAIGVNIYTRTGVDAAASRKKIIPKGYIFNTRDIAPEIKGFGASHIEMQVELDRNGNIKKVSVLSHNETPEYASGISQPEFLDQFKGKGVEDAFIVGGDIDAITRATISSRAVALTLKTCLERIDAAKKGLKEKRETLPLNLNLDFYITVLIITFLLIAFYLRLSWLRYTGLVVSIAYFGFWKANFISMTSLGNVFLWNILDLRQNLSWYVFIFSGLILTFLLGAFYCSHMCPFGGLQIFLNRIFRFNIDVTPGLVRILRKIKYFLLWILLIALLVSNNLNLVNYEPFSTVFLRRGNIIAWAIVLIVLVSSLVHYRPFCNYFCAAGAFLEILSKAGRRIFRRR